MIAAGFPRCSAWGFGFLFLWIWRTSSLVDTGSFSRADASQTVVEPGGSERFRLHVVWTLAARAFAITSVAAAGIVVARWLGPRGVGELATINVIILVALLLASFGLPSATSYFAARDPSSLGSLFANSVIFSAVAGVLVAVAVFMLSSFVPSVFGDIPSILITVAAASLPFQLMTTLGLNLLLGVRRILSFNLLDSGGQSIVLLNALVGVVILGKGLPALVMLNTLTAALLCIIVCWTIRRVVIQAGSATDIRPDRALFKQVAEYGLKFQISTIAALLIIRADLLIVNYFRGAAEAGVYAVASQAANLLMLVPGVIGTLLMPRVAGQFHEASQLTMRVTRHTTFLMLGLCILAVPAAFLLPVFYGSAFSAAVTQLLILLPGVFLVSIESVLVHYFTGTGLPSSIPIFWSICLVVNVTLNLTFVPKFGAIAAAASSSITYTLIFIMIATFFRKRTGSKVSDTFFVTGREVRELLTLARPNAWR